MEKVSRKIFNRKGISSLELAVVLALIAIMATFTIPYLGSWLKHYRVVGASREVASTLQEARIKAVANNREWQVVFNYDNDSYKLRQGNADSGSTTWTDEGGTKSLPKGVIFTKSDGDDDSGQCIVQFNPSGTVVDPSSGTATEISIYVKGENGERYKITVIILTGRVAISYWDGTWKPT